MSAAFRLSGTLETLEPKTALLWEAGCRGIVQVDSVQGGSEVVAYFGAPVHLPLEGRWEEVNAHDWVADYYAGLAPVAIGRLMIAPTHRTVALSAGQRALWLDPGMAFGTGHHATTHLALAALEGCDLTDKRVLDVGAGSGILAIAADLLGAAGARGLDTDPATLLVARANAALNLSRARFNLGTLDAGVSQASAEVIVANLFAELHAELAPAYARALRPGGVLFATGVLAERLGVAQDALAEHLEIVSVSRREEWVLLHARKTRPA